IDLRGCCARDRRRAGTRQLLPAPRDDGEMTRTALALLAVMACLSALAPAPASASAIGKVCNLAGGIAGKACDLAQNPGKALSAGKNLLTGHIGSAVKDFFG